MNGEIKIFALKPASYMVFMRNYSYCTYTCSDIYRIYVSVAIAI